ncbi:MAG: PBP1A family penicillin-binding protein [Alphaproteobacteria bacterium]|nr:PBP1A family penicillin-binding protein [Alphaproteobacteria bacterium]
MARKIFRRKKLKNFALSAVIFSSLFFFFLFLFLIHDMPDLDNLESKGRRASIIFESYDGKNIATYGDLFKEVVTVDGLPKYVGDAIIAIEDHRFYHHGGVDFFGILRAMLKNLISGRIVQGGSTLTQQLAKNLFLSPNRSVKRKVQELVLALWLEKKFTKKQILSIYLNRVYFGSGAYGIDAAAYRFFGKRAKQLSLFEAAKLAGILKSPAKYSPFYNKEQSNQRTALVLSCMREEKFISAEAEQEALQEIEKPHTLSESMDENRYFTDWIMEHLEDIVQIDNEDLIIRTTLDSNLQKNAIYIIRKALNEEGFKNNATQMALVAIDKIGAIRAMVGGHTYSESQFNRALATRSFGSAFKYFVYLTALEHGSDIYDMISDMPIRIGNWSPKNYKYKSVGHITMLQAFAQSVNTCSIRLAQKVGMPAIIQKARDLGISSELNNNFATALGGSGTNLLEMTAAYGTTMANGKKITPFGIISIKTQRGKILYRAKKMKPKKIISDENCEKMKIMLKEIVENGTGKRAKIPVDCYGKTGTSNDSRDASFIGFSPPLVTGVWIGNDDNSPMNKSMTGGKIPADVWRHFMMSAFGFESPIDKVLIDRSKSKKRQRLKSLIRNLSDKSPRR